MAARNAPDGAAFAAGPDEQMGPFSNQPELDRLAYRMFRHFSRFEYALKATGHHPRDGDANPDWDDFARKIDGAFRERVGQDANLKAAVDFLMLHPPKKQRVVNEQLLWSVVPAGRGNFTEDLLVYVRRVRNNLFHGGKFSRGWLDPGRSETLIRHSLTILDACLVLSDRVRAAYEH